jgi:phytoene synthase
MTTAEVDVGSAYRHCESITRHSARNFYYGIALLPHDKRRALCALYAMARRIDDIGDDLGPIPARLAALGAVRQDLDRVAAGAPLTNDPVLVALVDAARRFPIPITALMEIVEGCEMDVGGRTYNTFEELVTYCRLVAGSVGRLSLSIYGLSRSGRDRSDKARDLADSLGIALQLTNILRDVVEDRDQLGRVYIPAEDRERFDVDEHLNGPLDALVGLICFEAARAHEWFERGLGLLPLLDHRSRSATSAMAGIYYRLLERIERDPAAVLSHGVSLGGWQKAGVAARALIGGRS